ncbi:hypothetical protein [Roseivivax sp. CAU 1761]
MFLVGTSSATEEIQTYTDDALVQPDLPLGDLLAEELDAEVRDGSLVFVLPAALTVPGTSDATLSEAAGVAVISALATLAETRAVFRDRELEALRGLARFYENLPDVPGFEAAGLDAAGFRLGIARALEQRFGALACAAQRCGRAEGPVRPDPAAMAMVALTSAGWEMQADLFAQVALTMQLGVADGLRTAMQQKRAI